MRAVSSDTYEAGQICYEAYAESVNWTAYDGKTIARWNDQDEDRRRAWAAGAEAVAVHVKAAVVACLIVSIPEESRQDAARAAVNVALASAQSETSGAAGSGCGASACCRADAAPATGGLITDVLIPGLKLTAQAPPVPVVDAVYAARNAVRPDVAHEHGDGGTEVHHCGQDGH